jgi:hypothetical protein
VGKTKPAMYYIGKGGTEKRRKREEEEVEGK